jgi:hypothetical protein
MLASVAQDMDAVSDELYAGSGFELTTMRVGVGLYLGVKFGVVKGKFGVTGYAYFTKTKQKANRAFAVDKRARPRILPSEIPLIDDEINARHLAYADAKGVRRDRIPGGDDGAERVIYYLQHEKFKSGLQRAAKLGAFFAQRADEKANEDQESKWFVNQIKPLFALSLEGNAGVVTIGGRVFLELTLKAI